MNVRHRILSVLSILILISCSCSTGPDNLSSQFSYDLHDNLTLSDIEATDQILEANIHRIKSDLTVEDLPVITVGVWSDYDNFIQAMEDDLGTAYYGATGYIFGMDEIRVFYSEETPVIALHEISHLVSLHLNNTLSNNPRWLWETVAVYEANQFYHPATLPWMVQGDYPTLEDLNESYTSSNPVYLVGFVLMEFTIETWGPESMIDLILSNGDIPGTLGTSVSKYETDWYYWLEEKYL